MKSRISQLFLLIAVVAMALAFRGVGTCAWTYTETYVGTPILNADDATVDGNTVLGNTAADTCIINAGPVTLPNATTAADGLILGGDVTLYRSGANVLTIPEAVTITDTITGNITGNVTGNVTGNQSSGSVSCTTLTSSGNTILGDNSTDTLVINAGPVTLPSATSAGEGLVLGGDVTLYRSAANVLTIPEAVTITGTITGNVTGNLTGNQSGGSVAGTTVTASTSLAVGSGGTAFTNILADTVSFGASETTKTLSLTGVASGDLPLGSIVSGNTSGVGIKSMATSTNSVLVTPTGTSGATTVVYVVVFRKP